MSDTTRKLGTYTMTHIQFEKTDLIDKYAAGVQKALKLIGHPEALVTDASRLGDFYFSTEEIAFASSRKWTIGDYIWELGKYLEQDAT